MNESIRALFDGFKRIIIWVVLIKNVLGIQHVTIISTAVDFMITASLFILFAKEKY